MKSQRGYINITGWDLAFIAAVIAVLGYAVLRGLEWLWPFIKAVIHSATA